MKTKLALWVLGLLVTVTAPGFVQAKPGAVVFKHLLVFDSTDRIVSELNVRVSKNRIEDNSGRYDIILVEPTQVGIKIRQRSQRGNSKEKIVIVAVRQNDLWVAAFPWNQYRMFSRTLTPTLSPSWQGLKVSDQRRAGTLSLSKVKPQSNPNILWGYKLPIDSMGLWGAEIFVAQRPQWQSNYGRLYSFTPHNQTTAVQFVTSNPPTTVASSPRPLAAINPGSEYVIEYVSVVPVIDGKATLYYLPSEPVANGDVITVFPRNGGNREMISCYSSTEAPFIVITIKEGSLRPERGITLRVSVGGIDQFTNSYKSVRYSIEFNNAHSGHALGGEIDAKRSAYVPWPSNIPIDNSYLIVRGSLFKVNGEEIKLPSTSYRVILADEAFVGPVGLYADRVDTCTVDSPTLFNMGSTFALPRRSLGY